MEIILAIVVASAVIFFGALISMGNERQRKAIDGLREQVVLWAVQDLKIKREHLLRAVQVPNPLDWLNKTASRIYGYDLKLQIVESFEEPTMINCLDGSNGASVIFTTMSPSDIRNFNKLRRSQLNQFTRQNSLFSLSNKMKAYEISPLNAGILFDLELPFVWNELTGKTIEGADRIWMYI